MHLDERLTKQFKDLVDAIVDNAPRSKPEEDKTEDDRRMELVQMMREEALSQRLEGRDVLADLLHVAADGVQETVPKDRR